MTFEEYWNDLDTRDQNAISKSYAADVWQASRQQTLAEAAEVADAMLKAKEVKR